MNLYSLILGIWVVAGVASFPTQNALPVTAALVATLLLAKFSREC